MSNERIIIDAQVVNLEQKLETQKLIIVAINKQLETQRELRERDAQKIEGAECKINEQDRTIRKLEERNTRQYEMIQDRDQKVYVLEKQIAGIGGSEAQIQRQAKYIRELKLELEQRPHMSYDHMMREMKARAITIEKLEQRIEGLENELEFTRDNSYTIHDYEHLEAQHDTAVDEYQNEIDRLTGELDRHQDHHMKFTRQAGAKIRELEKPYGEQVSKMQDIINVREEEIFGLKNELEFVRDNSYTIHDYEQLEAEHEADIEKLEDEADAMMHQYKALKMMIDDSELKATITKLERTRDDQATIIRSYRRDLEDANKERLKYLSIIKDVKHLTTPPL